MKEKCLVKLLESLLISPNDFKPHFQCNFIEKTKDDEDEDLKSCSLFFEFFPLSPSEKLI